MSHRRPRARVLAALALTALLAASAPAHEIPRLDETYLQGAFTPSYTPPEPGTYELPPIRRVGSFGLRNAEGRRVQTADLTRGKVSVVSFIYTACSDRFGCPLASLALREIQQQLGDAGLSGQTALVSVSLDPGRDTPARLATYARAYGADPARWHFLTADSEAGARTVFEAYGQDRTAIVDERGRPTGGYRHVLKVFLLDGGGVIRNIYSTGFLVPAVVVNDVKTLLLERR